MTTLKLDHLNKQLSKKTPNEIIDWALKQTKKIIVTTSFGKYSSAILSAVSNKSEDVDVIWCDTGYNTPETYEHAVDQIRRFKLNIHVYKPLLDRSTIETKYGLPGIDDPMFEEFKETVKLEPFRRAIHEHQPEVWFTNIRAGQTKHRDEQSILSYSKEGILKVSPFYFYSDSDLDFYLSTNNLPKNESYFDVTKVLANRECGIHLQ